MNPVETINKTGLTQAQPLLCNRLAIVKLESEYCLLMKGWRVPGDVPTIASALTIPLIAPGTPGKLCSMDTVEAR